ncbi:TrkA C-terminal domain-containing protein [Demequina litorisediminis]|uniref:RCK C-terminal domain-containing protein n=1 Tax=Demequina litorisediminis TaxID=1849022 RepID=A0ABQ6I848_9MICO|nr:hypothetical protein GCM10025876_01240 [Demequina litorisediminis]
MHDAWIGSTVAALEAATKARVAYVVRFGSAVLPEPTTTVQVDDELWFVIPDAVRAHAERTVSRVPGGTA